MRILFFAHLRDITGCAEQQLSLGASAGVDELWLQLIARYPDLTRFRSSVRLARNLEYVGPDAQFSDADEVALIPPVSGG